MPSYRFSQRSLSERAFCASAISSRDHPTHAVFLPEGGQAAPLNNAVRRLRGFHRAEDGAIIYLGLVVFLVILLVAGLAIDLTRYEAERMRFQTTADRAVLAATQMNPETSGFDPEDLVRAYFTAEGLGAAVEGQILVEQKMGTVGTLRTVTVAPQSTVGTFFMRWSGIDTLNLQTVAAAEHEVHYEQGDGPDDSGTGPTGLELVMVLDVSRSMRHYDRLENLKIAAVDLAETVLGNDFPGKTLLSVFPYDSFVVPPNGMINAFPHLSGSKGRCMEFTVWNQFLGSYNQPMKRMDCRNEDKERRSRIFMTDVNEAVDYLDGLILGNGTSIDQGVRFGAMMFDPSIQPVISHMIDLGELDEKFEGYPHGPSHANGPIQAMVVMTDGRNNGGGRSGTQSQFDQQMLDACTAVKQAGITIYAIAFEAPSWGEALMEACASSPGHYFETSGLEIVTTFETIGASLEKQLRIRNLKLTK